MKQRLLTHRTMASLHRFASAAVLAAGLAFLPNMAAAKKQASRTMEAQCARRHAITYDKTTTTRVYTRSEILVREIGGGIPAYHEELDVGRIDEKGVELVIVSPDAPENVKERIFLPYGRKTSTEPKWPNLRILASKTSDGYSAILEISTREICPVLRRNLERAIGAMNRK